MRVTMDIDEGLLRVVAELSGADSYSDAVRIALDEYVRAEKLRRLRELRGKLDIADEWEALRDVELSE